MCPPTSFLDSLPRPLPLDLGGTELESGQTTLSEVGNDSPRSIFLGLDVGESGITVFLLPLKPLLFDYVCSGKLI